MAFDEPVPVVLCREPTLAHGLRVYGYWCANPQDKDKDKDDST